MHACIRISAASCLSACHHTDWPWKKGSRRVTQHNIASRKITGEATDRLSDRQTNGERERDRHTMPTRTGTRIVKIESRPKMSIK